MSCSLVMTLCMVEVCTPECRLVSGFMICNNISHCVAVVSVCCMQLLKLFPLIFSDMT